MEMDFYYDPISLTPPNNSLKNKNFKYLLEFANKHLPKFLTMNFSRAQIPISKTDTDVHYKYMKNNF